MTALPDVSSAPEPIVTGEPTEVADGVYVIPDGRVPLVPNIGIVIGDQAALVIDTGLGPGNGKHVLGQAQRLAGDRPLFLTVTHFHPEHSFGAQAFKGAATIVYNRAQRDELRRKGSAYQQMFSGLSPAYATQLKDVVLVEPDITYVGEAEIDLGGRVARLNTWGPAHSAADQTVLADNVLFTGDLAETRMFPIAPHFPPHDTDVDIDRWITALEHLLALSPAVVVPGHGEVNDGTLLTEVRDYLTHIRDETRRLQAPPDEAVAIIEREARTRWSTWDNPEWIGFMVHAAYNTKASDQG